MAQIDHGGIPEDEPIMQNARIQAGVIYFPKENCQACHVLTSELYARTLEGKKYCIDCLNKGAGVDEYLNTGLENMVGEELKARARKNGFIQ